MNWTLRTPRLAPGALAGALALFLAAPPAAAEAAAPPPAAGAETVRVAAGAFLREVASSLARVLAVVDEESDLPLLDRSGEWVRVALGERTGWVDLADDPDAQEVADGWGSAGEGGLAVAVGASEGAAGGAGEGSGGRAAAGGEGSGGRGVAPRGMPAGAAEQTALPPAAGATGAAGASAEHGTRPPPVAGGGAELVAATRALLGEGAGELSWGRFTLLTDRPDHPLVALGAAIATALPDLHARRYGLPGAPSPVEAQAGSLGVVVVFARNAGYRAFLAAVAGADLAPDLAGHAGGGVAALPLGDRTARQAAGTLLHELAHLLNERALGQDLPAWLDEGLAGDLELVAVGSGGELIESRWAEGAIGYRGRRGRAGPLVALDRLLAAAARGRLETLHQLAALDRPALAASPRRAELYALAALWVRFLLDDADRAAAFRSFLAALAAAPAPPPDGGATLLADTLATDLATLERPFRHWLRDIARRH